MYLTKNLLSSFAVAFPKVGYSPAPYQGFPYEDVIEKRKKYSPDFYFSYYKKPLLITEGRMQYLYDHTGKVYQDWISGICTVSVGHSHPRVTEAMIDQSKTLVHVSQINLSTVQT